MALKKADLEGKLTEEQEKEIQALESKIDASLINNYIPGRDVRIDLGKKLHAKVRLELQRRYKAAGWKVEFCSDPDHPYHDRIYLS